MFYVGWSRRAIRLLLRPRAGLTFIHYSQIIFDNRNRNHIPLVADSYLKVGICSAAYTSNNMIRNAVTLERERKEYQRTNKLQEKELQELHDRKRRKPISVRSHYFWGCIPVVVIV